MYGKKLKNTYFSIKIKDDELNFIIYFCNLNKIYNNYVITLMRRIHQFRLILSKLSTEQECSTS